MKRILITGANSYIGTSVEKWLEKSSDNYQITTLDVKDDTWKKYDFSIYDSIFHVAGIAHVSSDPNLEDLYYKVNRDLTIAIAKKAKEENVKQFIFMSSIIIYGDGDKNLKVITKDTLPNPKNFYGDSKLQAEKGISDLKSKDFNIAIIRPPMIYGKGSKGNYPKLAKLAKITPIFPNIKNQRSMLHIDNLSELIKVVIDNNLTDIFYPQNKEYVCTSDLVKNIGKQYGNNVRLTKIFNPILIPLVNKLNITNKVFGNLVYDKQLSNIDYEYQSVSLLESIARTEV